MKRLIRFIASAWIRWRLKKELAAAISGANRMRAKTGKKYMVLYLFSEFRIYEKQVLKSMLRQGVFKRGVSMRDLEKSAYFITS